MKLWYHHVEYAITTNKRIHQMNITNEAKPFDISDMQTAFYILFVGLLCSTLVFFGEVMMDKRKRAKPFQFVH